MRTLAPAWSAAIRFRISSGVWDETTRPQLGQWGVPTRANRRRRRSETSVMVPTVERGLVEIVFWSIEMEGEMPSTDSTSGFSIWSMNWRA